MDDTPCTARSRRRRRRHAPWRSRRCWPPATADAGRALDWLESRQGGDGSFAGSPPTDVPNANSTGLAAEALAAGGARRRPPAGGHATSTALQHRLRRAGGHPWCGAPTPRTARPPTSRAGVPTDQLTRATTQAALGLRRGRPRGAQCGRRRRDAGDRRLLERAAEHDAPPATSTHDRCGPTPTTVRLGDRRVGDWVDRAPRRPRRPAVGRRTIRRRCRRPGRQPAASRLARPARWLPAGVGPRPARPAAGAPTTDVGCGRRGGVVAVGRGGPSRAGGGTPCRVAGAQGLRAPRPPA